MEKFICGYMDKVPIRMKLPVSRTSPAVPKVSAVKPSSASVSEEARVKVISMIVNKKRSYNDHQYPDFAHPVWSKELQEECHDVFKQLLDKHPFPLSQGPIVLPLDSLTSCLSEYRSRCEESVAKVLNDKTVFRHDESQACGKWIPQIVGVASWAAEHDSGGGSYLVTDKDDTRLEGPASTLDMSVVYPCQVSGCSVGCPCRICTEGGKNCCKSKHHHELCKKCDSQCSLHQIMVPYLFDATKDIFTVVTESLDKYRFGYKYAGMPGSCLPCSKDLLEHQCLHLVVHNLCRYCRYETRPLGYQNNVLSLEQYKKKEEALDRRDESTCSICMKESVNKTARLKHEAIVHKKETQKYKCDECPKSYTSIGTLQYHKRTRHGLGEEVNESCDMCGKQFSSVGALTTHKKFIHSTDDEPVEEIQCDVCCQTISSLSNFKRHMREQHGDWEKRLNLDFHEGIPKMKLVECKQCEKKFKRKSDLNRHVANIHEEKVFRCDFCENSYARKDNLQRHQKTKHAD
jgi:hypothetical protein